MKIAGLAKLTLLDYPEKTACTVFTWGCNLRCPFCHNAPLVTESFTEACSEDEFFAFLKKRQGILDGVCVSGGEPLLQPELPDFLRAIRNLGFLVKLDTNGTNPEKLRELIDGGLLDMVAMDLKNSPEKYAATCGTEKVRVEAVGESVRLLLQEKIPYEFRTTVVEEYHSAEDISRMARWIRGAKRYFLQQFQDSGHLIGKGLSGCTPEKMQQFLEIARKDVPNALLRGLTA